MLPEHSLELIAEIPIPRSGWGVQIAFSPIGSTLYHSGIGLRVQEFDYFQERIVREFTSFETNSPYRISLSMDGSLLAAEDGPHMRIWDTLNGKLVTSLQIMPISTFMNAGFLRGGETFFAVDYFGNLVLWESATWEELLRKQLLPRLEAGYLADDGETIVVQAVSAKVLNRIDVASQETVTIPINGEYPRLVSISPDGRYALVHINRNYPSEGYQVLEAATGKIEAEIPALNVATEAVSPNWTLLAEVDTFERLTLYRLPTGELIYQQQLPLFRVFGLTLSPDDRFLGIYGLKANETGGFITVWGMEGARADLESQRP